MVMAMMTAAEDQSMTALWRWSPHGSNRPSAGEISRETIDHTVEPHLDPLGAPMAQSIAVMQSCPVLLLQALVKSLCRHPPQALKMEGACGDEVNQHQHLLGQQGCHRVALACLLGAAPVLVAVDGGDQAVRLQPYCLQG